MAPLTADQFKVAAEDVIPLVVRLVGAAQPEAPEVVNVDWVEYPDEQLAFTCHT